MAASAAVAQQQQQEHQTLPPPFPADDHPGLDPPPALYPAEAVYRFAHGEFGDADADLLGQLHSLEAELARLEVREEEVRIEMGDFRKEARRCDAELRRVQLEARPLVVAQLDELVGADHAVVTIPETSHSLYVGVLSAVDRALLAPSATVLLLASSPGAVVGVLPDAAGSSAAVDSFIVTDEDTPSVTYDDIAGCEAQKREVREAVELPLTHPELFARLGVDPPRGVLLHGPPGTGKTMLARAVARHTSASFLRVSGAELAGGRFLGSGPRMVRDVLRLARERAPCIVFIDEADAVAAARLESGATTGADREAQRVLLELLAQMDGFDSGGGKDDDDGVRVIMATNRADALDPALLRPGRLDRKVEFTRPDTARERRQVFQACAAWMSLDGDVGLDELAARRDGMSAAEIAAVCFEAGMRAVRGNRCAVTREDFEQGYRAVAEKLERDAYHEFSFYS